MFSGVVVHLLLLGGRPRQSRASTMSLLATHLHNSLSRTCHLEELLVHFPRVLEPPPLPPAKTPPATCPLPNLARFLWLSTFVTRTSSELTQMCFSMVSVD